MIRSLSILLTCLYALLSTQLAFSSDLIKVLAVEYPPFTTSKDSDGGLVFRYLTTHPKFPGKEKRFLPVFVPPARANLFLKEGRFCVSFYPPESGSEAFLFFPLRADNVRLGLIRKRQTGDFAWQSLSELAGKTVAVLRNDPESLFLKQFTEAGLKLFFVDEIAQGIGMVRANRVDFAFGDDAALSYLKKEVGADIHDLQFSSSVLMEAPIGFYYRKTCEDRLFDYGNG